jgi:ribonuclease P protein component
MRNTLKSYERLKSLKCIDYIFSKEGKSIHEEDLTIRYALVKISDYPLKAGFSVSKRLYKRAHDRNKYKRWLRESYRTRKAALIESLKEKELAIHLFLILKTKAEGKTFQDIEKQVESSLNKLWKRLIA